MSVESLRIHPAALEEGEAAVDWYAQRSRRAAGMFPDELDRAIDQIGQNPEQYPRYDFGTRRIVLRRFPFEIVSGRYPPAWRSSRLLTVAAIRVTGGSASGKPAALAGMMQRLAKRRVRSLG